MKQLYDAIRYDTINYVYVRPKLTNSQVNLPHGTKKKQKNNEEN